MCMRAWDVPNLSRGCEPHGQLWRSRRSVGEDLLLYMNLDLITISAHLFTCLSNLFGYMHVCLFGSCLFGHCTSLFHESIIGHGQGLGSCI